jgi:uncharacterized protein (TIGR02453 family)
MPETSQELAMANDCIFSGFPKECFEFFEMLENNNNRPWFEEHRSDYEQFVKEPARDFVVALGARLRKLAPRVHAEPLIDRSIFRINRDTRFSHDKSPYKTHLGLWFWEGNGNRMECSGFYIHFDPPRMWLGVGIYIFPPFLLHEYRRSCVHDTYGKQLSRIVSRVTKVPGTMIGNESYKRVPRGYDPDHRNADLLRFNGFHAGIDIKIPKVISTPKSVDFCYDKLKPYLPVHKWLYAMTERADRDRRGRDL